MAINDIFKDFYTNLYKAETDFDEPICKQYLDKFILVFIFPVAQMAEHGASNAKIMGSFPGRARADQM